jgi:hypothetical protein
MDLPTHIFETEDPNVELVDHDIDEEAVVE